MDDPLNYPDTVTDSPKFSFDGHEFHCCAHQAQGLWVLRIAYDARRGDPAAKYFLESFRIAVVAADGKKYWPMEEAS